MLHLLPGILPSVCIWLVHSTSFLPRCPVTTSLATRLMLLCTNCPCSLCRNDILYTFFFLWSELHFPVQNSVSPHVYSHACFAYCQKFCISNFCYSGPLNFIFTVTTQSLKSQSIGAFKCLESISLKLKWRTAKKVL